VLFIIRTIGLAVIDLRLARPRLSLIILGPAEPSNVDSSKSLLNFCFIIMIFLGLADVELINDGPSKV